MVLLKLEFFLVSPSIVANGDLAMGFDESNNSIVIFRATFEGIVSDTIEGCIDFWRWVAGAKDVIGALSMNKC